MPRSITSELNLYDSAVDLQSVTDYAPLPCIIKNESLPDIIFFYSETEGVLEKHDPLNTFQTLMQKISGVEAVYFSYQAIPSSKDIIHFYTVINEDSKETRRKIYSVEMALMKEFGKARFNFDFHVIARCGRDLSEVLKSPGCNQLFDKYIK